MATRAEIEDTSLSIARLAKSVVSDAEDVVCLPTETLRISRALRQLQEVEQLLMQLLSELSDDFRIESSLRD